MSPGLLGPVSVPKQEEIPPGRSLGRGWPFPLRELSLGTASQNGWGWEPRPGQRGLSGAMGLPALKIADSPFTVRVFPF